MNDNTHDKINRAIAMARQSEIAVQIIGKDEPYTVKNWTGDIARAILLFYELPYPCIKQLSGGAWRAYCGYPNERIFSTGIRVEDVICELWLKWWKSEVARLTPTADP